MTDTDILEEQDQADAAVAALTGGAVSRCPNCNVKTISREIFKEDREHPDQMFFCDGCRLHWEIFIPEGLLHLSRDSKRGMVPFDAKGNQQKWEYGLATRQRPNFEFEDTLTWLDNKSRSMHNFLFRRQSTGKTVAIMTTDFKKFLPLMTLGQITGRFTFRNRGGCSGVSLVKEKKPRKPRKSRAKVRAPIATPYFVAYQNTKP